MNGILNDIQNGSLGDRKLFNKHISLVIFFFGNQFN